jgi:hypothetical protein
MKTQTMICKMVGRGRAAKLVPFPNTKTFDVLSLSRAKKGGAFLVEFTKKQED